MRFNNRRTTLSVHPGVSGTARVARRASQLLPRLKDGDIAVVDHHDLDRDTALRMLDKGVVAVVNAAPMISGRYANLGPEVLAEAGVPLLDNVGPERLGRRSRTASRSGSTRVSSTPARRPSPRAAPSHCATSARRWTRRGPVWRSSWTP